MDQLGFAGNKLEKKAKPASVQTGDIFEHDWQAARAHAVEREHPKYNWAYLAFRSILTLNAVYGADFIKTVGLQSYVPLTFQAIEACAAQMNARRIVIKNKSRKLKGKKRQDSLNKMDNDEWRRSKGDAAKAEVTFYTLLCGIGWWSNLFYDEKIKRHFLKPVAETAPQNPEDGVPDTDRIDPTKLEWEEKEVSGYRGMKAKAENPWCVFPNPNAVERSNMGHVYRYSPVTVVKAREFVVSKGWMTQDEADVKITEQAIEKFDAIRDEVDALYSISANQWSRGDHQDGRDLRKSTNGTEAQKGMTAFIERFEEDYYEIRLVGTNEALYKDYNVYPHKRIPLVPTFNDKVPHELRGIGEPEKMRWQQIDMNRLNGATFQSVLLAAVQRFVLNTAYLQNENDASWQNPFKPIRLKQGLPGAKASDAVFPLPQPEVKQTPFEMMDRIRTDAQKTTGASDFVVSASSANTDTATESNRLAAATNARIREKMRDMEKEAIPELISQNHACYPLFYDEGLEFRIDGDEEYGIFVCYEKADVNESQEMIAKIAKEFDVTPATTLEETYKSAGYDQIIFLDDVLNEYDVEIETNDADVDRFQNIDALDKVLNTMAVVNKSQVESGMPKRFDVMKLAKEQLRNFPQISDPDEYEIDMQAPPKPTDTGLPFPTPPAPNPNDPAGMPFPGQQSREIIPAVQ